MEHATNFGHIQAAFDRITPYILKTPLLESAFINEKLNGRVLFKAEPLQYTGSFKFRGAMNTILSLTNTQKKNGVVAFSSGNHAQAVAYAAQLQETKATIIMPADAPTIKIENTKAYGAEVILYDRWTEDREAIGQKITDKTGAYLIKPYDAILTIAGQGTIGIEIANDCKAQNIIPDYIISPCGGGGLMAGLSLAIKENFPDAKIYSAEPEYFNDTALSLASGKIQANQGNSNSICDALLSPQPGNLTFPINKRLLSGGFSVSDHITENAIQDLFTYLKLVVEPGGAVGYASLLDQNLALEGKTALVVLSGGNIDSDLFSKIIKQKQKQ